MNNPYNEELVKIKANCILDTCKEEMDNNGKRQPEVVCGWIDKAFALGRKHDE